MFTIVIIVPALILFFILPVTSKEFAALKFGDDGYSVIAFNPNMSPLTEKLTVCLWMKKLLSGREPMPYAYESSEMYMRDFGYSHMLSTGNTLSSEFRTPMRVWTHYCGTWSVASRTFRTYINGKLAGSNSQITASGYLRTPGYYVH